MYHLFHGGRCCGMSHITGFPTYSDAQKQRLKRLTHCHTWETDGKSRCIEVVLTTRKSQKWHDAVKDIGYKEVNRFVNPGTGNTCVVYHYSLPVEARK